MIGATGIWSEEEQSGHIFSYGVAKWIADNTKGQLIDLGAGNCTYTIYFRDRGRGCIAIDGYDNGKVSIVVDLAAEVYEPVIKGTVLCLEMFEHVPKEFEYILVQNIINHCSGTLIISVAHEGQLGTGHVNCRPDWYVKELFEGKGFKFEKELTESIRQQPEGYVAYLKENLFVFTKL